MFGTSSIDGIAGFEFCLGVDFLLGYLTGFSGVVS